MIADSSIGIAIAYQEGGDHHLIRTEDIYQADYDDGTDGYSENALALVRDAQNTGVPEGCNAVGTVGQNKRQTVALQLFARVNEETDVIEQAGFRARGCLAMIAAGTMIARMIEGRTRAEALQITREDLHEAVGEVPEIRYYTFRYSIEAVHALVNDYLVRKGAGYAEMTACESACDLDSMACLSCETCSYRETLSDLRIDALLAADDEADPAAA